MIKAKHIICFFMIFLFPVTSHAIVTYCNGPNDTSLNGPGMITLDYSLNSNTVFPTNIGGSFSNQTRQIFRVCDTNLPNQPTPVYIKQATVSVTAIPTNYMIEGKRVFKLNGSDDFGFTAQVEVSSGRSSYYRNVTDNNPISFFTSTTTQTSSLGFYVRNQLVMLKKPRDGTATIAPAQSIGKVHIEVDSVFQSNENLPPINTMVTLDPKNYVMTSRTCSIKGSNQYNINMSRVNNDDFDGSGSEIDGQASSTINLTCDKGVTPFAVITDATDSSNTSSELTLDTNSTAKGIKVRLYRDGNKIVYYGPQSREAGALNQFQFGSIAETDNASRSIVLSGRYYQTEEKITPGRVSAKAIITFSYQ